MDWNNIIIPQIIKTSVIYCIYDIYTIHILISPCSCPEDRKNKKHYVGDYSQIMDSSCETATKIRKKTTK